MFSLLFCFIYKKNNSNSLVDLDHILFNSFANKFSTKKNEKLLTIRNHQMY